MAGTLYGVGVGPGDPELLTLKAARLLASVPVVAYPRLGRMPSFARKIVAAHLTAGQAEIAFEVPLGGHELTLATYDAAAGSIGEVLARGDDVAVLCEGDPMVYGSFVYLHSRLADRYATEIVSGISSITATPARLGRPLAVGDETVVILPATLPDDVLEARMQAQDCIVIMKLGRHLARIRALLDRLGLTDDADYIERATLPDERCSPLAVLDADPAPYFSMIIIRRRMVAPQ